jgi:hypothetical protein
MCLGAVDAEFAGGGVNAALMAMIAPVDRLVSIGAIFCAD